MVVATIAQHRTIPVIIISVFIIVTILEFIGEIAATAPPLHS